MATIRRRRFDFTINRHFDHDFIRSESAPEGSPSTHRLPTSAEANLFVITKTIRQNNKIECSDADEWYIFINRSRSVKIPIFMTTDCTSLQMHKNVATALLPLTS
jgi:hypothetical protein